MYIYIDGINDVVALKYKVHTWIYVSHEINNM